jgi:amino acid adenylation domain-containing protein
MTDFSDRLAALSPEQRALFELRRKHKGLSAAQDHSIARRKSAPHYPLSFDQLRLWFLHQFAPDNPAYNINGGVRLTGLLNLDLLERSINEIVRRHEILRTTFTQRVPAVEGQPVQLIAPSLTITVALVDLSRLSPQEQAAAVPRLATQATQQPFDLQHGPLIRTTLLRLAADDHILITTMHHIVTDRWSLALFEQELAVLYHAFSNRLPSPLPELPIQFADFVIWQQQWMHSEKMQAQLAYWMRRLADLPPVHQLPTDHPRPVVPSYRGARCPVELAPNAATGITALSRQSGTTRFITLLALFMVLLARQSGQTDIVVGSPIANRGRAELARLIGFFLNTLIFRADLSHNPTFRDYVAQMRQIAAEAYANQDVPFDRLVAELRPERDTSRNPLFQITFIFLEFEESPEVSALPGMSVKTVETSAEDSRFDLTFALWGKADGISGFFEYSTDLFEPTTIATFAQHFQLLAEKITADPDQRVFDIPCLTDSERQRLLVDWNATARTYPQDRCVHQLIEDQAARTPHAVAIVFGDQLLTYAELNGRANQLAHHLRALGVGDETLVGLCLERSPQLIIALLAILKAGGAYLPLDPSYPADRLRFMLTDGAVPVLLTQHALAEALPTTSALVLDLDADCSTIAARSTENPTSAVTADNLAYVIYTSGSTGTPKGVMVSHRGITRLLFGIDYAQLDASQVFLHMAPISFDASTFEIWGALLHGARCVLLEDRVPTTTAIGRAIQEYGVSTLWLTAALFNTVIDEAPHALRGVRQLLIGGEALSVRHVERALQALPETQIINGYGPTESTTFACCYPIPPLADRRSSSIPIGRPIGNTTAYLLDGQAQPVPRGVPGELFIGGAGLARGYHNRPDLTAERFIPDPYSVTPGSRLYRSGDLARYGANGALQFLRRIDQQVKVRGYRIELGEIEATLMRHPAVREAAVIIREDTPPIYRHPDRQIVAYLVPHRDMPPNSQAIRDFLAQQLPAYMLPSAIVLLEALPLTPSGKLDRRALPAPDWEKTDPQKAYTAPRDALELQLVQIWEELLPTRPIGVKDSFFDLGGHSLDAIRLVAQIQKRLGQNLALAALFEGATIEQLAHLLRRQSHSQPASVVAIRSTGSKPPFFCVHPAGGDVLSYKLLAQFLAADQPFYGLQAPGISDQATPYTCVKRLAAYHIAAVRTVQPEGPYLLGGWSFGGVVAFEMAQQLQQQEATVALVVLLDSFVPGIHHHSDDDAELLAELAQAYGGSVSADELRPLDPQDQLPYVLQQANDRISPDLGLPQLRRYFQIYKANLQAIQQYEPQRYTGQISLLRARQKINAEQPDPAVGWLPLSRQPLKVIDVPGTHQTMIEEPHVRIVAEHLQACLDAAHTH